MREVRIPIERLKEIIMFEEFNIVTEAMAIDMIAKMNEYIVDFTVDE